MMMANGAAEIRYPEEPSAAGGEDCENPEHLSIDLEALWGMLGDKNSDPPQSMLGGSPDEKPQGNSSSTHPFSATSFKPEALDCRIGVSNGSPSDLTGRPVIIDAPKFDSSFQVGSAVHVSDGSLSDWKLPGNESSGVELDMPSYDEPLSASNPAETFDYLGGNWGQYPDILSADIPSSSSSLLQQDFQYKSDFKLLPCNGDKMLNSKEEEQEPPTRYTSTDSMIGNEDLTGSTDEVWDGPTIANSDIKDLNFNSCGVDNSKFLTVMKASDQQHGQSSRFCTKSAHIKDRKDELINRKPFGAAETVIAKELSNPHFPRHLPFHSSKMDILYGKHQNKDMFPEFVNPGYHSNVFIDGTSEMPILINHDHGPDLLLGEKHLSLPTSSVKNQLGCARTENTHISGKTFDSHMATFTPQVFQISSYAEKPYADTDDDDDDDDVCILEDLSAPARPNPCVSKGKSLVTFQHATFSETFNHAGVGQMRLKLNNEQSVFQAALQDLSQPRSEDTPPDDALAVPLLRHQRIALSWMVKKETMNPHCSGGILADDQGLGKTISTISLILKERPSSVRVSTAISKQTEAETLNLDEDTAVDTQLPSKSDSCQANGSPITGAKKGRAAAGTLVVCPTSVLRQWSDELHNKVTSKANLSVLVYHGSNRTKDPLELAKYDVVVTTYAIVSMEVPKQRLVEDEDDETGKRSEGSMELSYSKKRKNPPSSGKKSSKLKKGTDSELLDTYTRPLARVAWFRVVLDEAQYIKNHKTQVARACWGLRAKRRWCLSGTPIQNAIDDLYSYFRFLRFDPYSSHKVFCASLKVPIQKNSSSGYKKLQAVLKTVMLRRTKGTHIDGEPIIALPPKRIELKKVEFTDEERNFYCKLEADSRAQFAKYAAAGTVKQNYVNILLMLLRLRQACDHPLLVGGSNSSSVWRSSTDMAKKLPQEKQIELLNCLEASLAICGVCNDPPEDAVVSICGHVFCNQCICEQLTGDDTHCPAQNCKMPLSVSSVFSKSILVGSLSDQPNVVTDLDCPGSRPCKTSDFSSMGCSSYDSSKIKAALEVLLSLSKPQESTPRIVSRCDQGQMSCSGDSQVKMNLDTNGYSKCSTKIAGEKALVFSQWTGMLDLLEACLKTSSIQYRRLDGTMSIVARDKAVKDFNTIPEVTVMIMSLKAASLGLNLVSACHVLLLDLWWNPTTEDQAIDRAHRIGQTRPVTVLRLTVKDTVEDRILALQQKKREMVASAFGEDENGARQTRLTTEDLEYLFRI
nr:helicase-like transcription factor CHR28 [Ipomoea trifida]